jgi:serine/threonine protein kinase
MGIVYLARVAGTGQPVALKVMVPESSTSERSVQLFLREVSVLSRLDHPRIVRFHETGFGNGQFYFAMEYVDAIEAESFLTGLSVAARIRTACGLVCQVLAGLEYAHGQSFVHRDVKPRNILVSREGKSLGAKLADFGLAKNFENAGFSGITRAGQTVGTLAYMAPEQSVDARLATPGSDIYSTGATLYRFLTGHPPHHFPRGKDPILVILEDEPIGVRDRCPDLPAGLADVVHRAIAREPSDRFAGAAEMRQALLPFARGNA